LGWRREGLLKKELKGSEIEERKRKKGQRREKKSAKVEADDEKDEKNRKWTAKQYKNVGFRVGGPYNKKYCFSGDKRRGSSSLNLLHSKSTDL